LLEHPEWINQSPYESGWIVKLKPSNMEEFHNLLTNQQYNKFIGETEENREKYQSGD
jgi:glycine cleavage system H protein